MPIVRLLIVLFILALAGGADAPVHAQVYDDGYNIPPPQQNWRQRRSRQQREYAPSARQQYAAPQQRQYIPPQPPQRSRRSNFLERLFPRLGMPAPRWSEPATPQIQAPRRAPRARADAASPPPVRRRVIPPSTFVAVLGDSLAENLANGLVDALSERPEVGLVREIRPGVGFLKENERSWRQIADEILARNPPVVAAVVFMGPHDDPPAAGKKTDAPAAAPGQQGSPWMDLYAAHVDDMTLAFRQKNIPLLWVGLPPVADPKASADNAFLNELVQQRITSLGGTFIDVWEGFVDSDEAYMAQGPDLDGRNVRLRMADGLHFTEAGARKLAHYVELELRPLLIPKDQGEALADIAKDIDAAPKTPGSSRILLLGEAPRTPGAVLVPSSVQPAMPDAPVETAQRAIATGEAVPPKPGRADDFAWPQNVAN